MAQPPAKRGKNEPEPRPIIIKKIIAEAHAGHHGGAWKVAYADFVTAMMAFFLLMWLLGATSEKQRKGIADYFAPTMIQMKDKTGGGKGMFGGESLIDKDKYSYKSTQTGSKSLTMPKDATGGEKEGAGQSRNRDRVAFQQMKEAIEKKMATDPKLKALAKNIRFVETREGLRIDLVDQADFAMFKNGTDQLVPQAFPLIRQVAEVVKLSTNDIIVRGHTDAMPYAAGRTANNWTLSSGRAESTRRALADSGIANTRFARIEGVADREPYVRGDVYDPRNRRMSITLAWSGGPDSDESAERTGGESRAPTNLLSANDPTALPAEARAPAKH
jgi:chemotaxis protein MotB